MGRVEADIALQSWLSDCQELGTVRYCNRKV